MTVEQDTRERIITSARDLIYSRSYAAVGVAEICAQAEVKKGSFYYFFPSKQALSLAVIDNLHTLMTQRILAPAFDKDLPPLQRLQRFVEKLYEFQRHAASSSGKLLGCPFGNLALEMSTSDDIIRGKLELVFADIQTRFAQVLQDALMAGDVEAIDVTATAQGMLAYIEGVLTIAKTANDPDLIRQLGPAVANIRISPRSGPDATPG